MVNKNKRNDELDVVEVVGEEVKIAREKVEERYKKRTKEKEKERQEDEK